jgi:hypothetical protein
LSYFQPSIKFNDSTIYRVGGRSDRHHHDIARGPGQGFDEFSQKFAYSKGAPTTNNFLPRTPQYKVGDTNQELLLEIYVNEIYRPSVEVSFEESRSGVFNIDNYTNASVASDYNRGRQEGRGILTSSDGNNQDIPALVAEKQLLLYQHLNNNLSVGYRLMFGHKVNRREFDFKTQGLTLNAIKPETIYKDINYSSNGIGLSNGVGLFTKKRAFLGHADKFPLTIDTIGSTTNSLNPDSVFYPNAIKASLAISRGIDANSVIQPVTDEIQEKMVYSIPLEEKSVKIDCFEDLFSEYLLEVKEGLNDESGIESMISAATRTRNISDAAASSRREFFKSVLFDKYNDQLLSDLLSLEQKKGGKRVITNLIEAGDYSKSHRMLFEHLFPVDRYASVHFLQNLEVYNKDGGAKDILKATKLFILQHILIMEGVGNTSDTENVTAAQEEADRNGEMLKQNIGAPELSSGSSDIMDMIVEAILNAAADATAAAVRKITETLDIGYKDMRKGYKKDPCKMKAGLTHKLVGTIPSITYGKLESNGFGKKSDGCMEFVPANFFVSDFLLGVITFNKTIAGAAILNLGGLISNITTGTSFPRYGMPFGPLAPLALSVRENRGEKHSKLREDNDCKDCSDNKEVVTPQGECED